MLHGLPELCGHQVSRDAERGGKELLSVSLQDAARGWQGVAGSATAAWALNCSHLPVHLPFALPLAASGTVAELRRKPQAELSFLLWLLLWW